MTVASPSMDPGAKRPLPLAELLKRTTRAISDVVPQPLLHPKIGIVCGSGLSTIASSLRDGCSIEYSKLDGFAESTGEHTQFLLFVIAYTMVVNSSGPQKCPGVWIDWTWRWCPRYGDARTCGFSHFFSLDHGVDTSAIWFSSIHTRVTLCNR